MKIGAEIIKLLVTLVTFVAVYWLFNAIWGDGE
jgi:F0F1-type ATP synthase assembly protein I